MVREGRQDERQNLQAFSFFFFFLGLRTVTQHNRQACSGHDICRLEACGE